MWLADKVGLVARALSTIPPLELRYKRYSRLQNIGEYRWLPSSTYTEHLELVLHGRFHACRLPCLARSLS